MFRTLENLEWYLIFYDRQVGRYLMKMGQKIGAGDENLPKRKEGNDAMKQTDK